MGRHHAAIDPRNPLAEFASGLRALKLARKLTYRQMSRRARFCVAALSAAASGRDLPTLQVTLAYVQACDGPEDEWRKRWEQLDLTRNRAAGRDGSHA